MKLCARPGEGGSAPEPDKDADDSQDKETFIFCRSRDRSEKEEAMVQRFEQKIEQRLVAMTARCEKQKREPMKVELSLIHI